MFQNKILKFIELKNKVDKIKAKRELKRASKKRRDKKQKAFKAYIKDLTAIYVKADNVEDKSLLEDNLERLLL